MTTDIPRAVRIEGEVYCNRTRCIPYVLRYNAKQRPIEATEEVPVYPCCATCGEVHEYMRLVPEESSDS